MAFEDTKLTLESREKTLSSLIEDAKDIPDKSDELFFLHAELQIVRNAMKLLDMQGTAEIEPLAEDSGKTGDIAGGELSIGVYGEVHSARSKYLYQLLDIPQAVASSVDEMCEGREEELLDSLGIHSTD